MNNIDLLVKQATSKAKVIDEELKRARLASGELSLDIYDMRSRLEEAGFEYIDSLDDLES